MIARSPAGRASPLGWVQRRGRAGTPRCCLSGVSEDVAVREPAVAHFVLYNYLSTISPIVVLYAGQRGHALCFCTTSYKPGACGPRSSREAPGVGIPVLAPGSWFLDVGSLPRESIQDSIAAPSSWPPSQPVARGVPTSLSCGVA